MLGGGTFADRAKGDQWRDLERAARNAEWDVPAGRIGGIIRQLRRRGEDARRRATVIFWVLIFVIALGLAFYLLLPFWQQFADGRKQTLNTQIADINARLSALAAQRDAQHNALIELLDTRFHRVRAADGENLHSLGVVNGDLYVAGEDGSVLRLNADSQSFDTLLSPDGGFTYLPVGFNNTIYVSRAQGAILRLSDEGPRFETTFETENELLNQLYLFNGGVFATGYNGTIWRLQRGEDEFRPVRHVGERLNIPVEFQGDLYFSGFKGTLLRLPALESGFEVVQPDTGGRLRGSFVRQGVLIFNIAGGSALQLSDTETRLEPIYSDIGRLDYVAWDSSDRLLGLTGRGHFAYLAKDGVTWNSVLSPGFGQPFVAFEFNGHLHVLAQNRFVDQEEGLVLRLREDETAFETLLTTPGEFFGEYANLSGQLYLFGTKGTVLRLNNETAGFDSLREADDQLLRKVAEYQGNLYAITDQGAILRWSPGHGGDVWAEFNRASKPEGESTDARIRRFVEWLRPEHRLSGEFQAIDAELLRIQTTRAGLLEMLDATAARRDVFEDMPYAALVRQDKQISFASFMEACRSDIKGVDLTKLTEACLAYRQAQNEIESSSWWRTLSEQVPPGILLLFLLGVLTGLYRYNMRLSGFHHSRADMLELYADKMEELTSMEDLATLTAALASDTVGFGRMDVSFGAGKIGIERARSE